MKKSLYICIALFSLLTSVFHAQSSELELTFTNNDYLRSLSSNLNFNAQPMRNGILNIVGQNTNEQRLSFAQKSRRSLLEANLDLSGTSFVNSITAGYEYLFDSSELENDLHPYKNKTGFLGYGIAYAPADSMQVGFKAKGLLRAEEDRYLMGNVLDSNGYELSGEARAGTSAFGSDIGISGAFTQRSLDWERFRSATLRAYLNHPGETLSVFNSITASKRADDLFVLAENELTGRGFYSLYDNQVRSGLTYAGFVDYNPNGLFSIQLGEVYSHGSNTLQQNEVRSNTDLMNQIELEAGVQPLSGLQINLNASHVYTVKDFTYARSSRHTETRGLNGSALWEYTPGDTLSIGASVDLQRTSFPDDGNKWDNDLRNIRFNVANIHYWRDRIKLSNRVFANIADDIYTDGVLSSNNKRTSSLIYNPSCAILIGDRLMFNQDYQLRADYTDYVYDTSNKGFYRQLSMIFDVVFDSYPYIARSQDQRWMLIPYRNPGASAFMVDWQFGYEHNEYADYDGSAYLIDFKNTKYSASMTLKHDIRDLYYILQPKYSWGTWKEYELLLGLAWKISDSSMFEVSINPKGDAIRSLDWRTTINLRAGF